MTDRELRKLSRAELLELLIAQMKENDGLRRKLDAAGEQIRNRELKLEEAGSIAEAALQLNGVFEAADAAVSQYVANIKRLNDRQQEVCGRREAETRQKCECMKEETRQKCENLEAETRQKCERMETEIREKCKHLEAETQKKCDAMAAETEKRCGEREKKLEVRYRELAEKLRDFYDERPDIH